MGPASASARELAYAQRRRPAQVVHLDDFLNPRAIRYRRGRSSPEGYFLDTYDLAAFTTKVLKPLRPGGSRAVTLRAFDHRADRRLNDTPVVVPPQAVVIVEGMFLHRDELHSRWDLSAFLDVPFSISVRRMAERDGSNPDPEHPSLRRYVQGQPVYKSYTDVMGADTTVRISQETRDQADQAEVAATLRYLGDE